METEFLSLLAKQNVWWEGRIENDVHLAQWKTRLHRWTPLELDTLPLEPFALNVVIGPRQAGKTTLLKFAVEKLIKTGVDPKSILYLRCDEVTSEAQLREIIESFLAFAGSKGVFIFLDEVTEVKNWAKTVKGLIDDGDLKQAAITVSGSNAFQLQKGSELFPGRRGKGKDIYVLPLLFSEYLKVIDPDLAAKVHKLDDLTPVQIAGLKKLLPLAPELEKHLHNYLQCGGFPLSIQSFLENGKVSEEAKETYRSWVIGDILKNGKSDVIAREVLKVILSKAPTPVSWEGISQETSIKSPPTIASYIELFERLFVVLTLYAVKPGGSREFAKNKKIHLLDPLLWHLCEEWCLQKIERKTETIVEACLAVHLARFLALKHKAKRLNDAVSYWRNGTEIDVVVHNNGLHGFEMKWSNRRQSFAFKKGPIKTTYVSKGIYLENALTIPLPLLLAAL